MRLVAVLIAVLLAETGLATLGTALPAPFQARVEPLALAVEVAVDTLPPLPQALGQLRLASAFSPACSRIETLLNAVPPAIEALGKAIALPVVAVREPFTPGRCLRFAEF